MAGPYFPKAHWAAFVHQGQTYDLGHLDEYVLAATDSTHMDRRIAVTFGDHCFTRKPEPGDDPTLAYSGSDRDPGHFCFERYRLSCTLRGHIAQAVGSKVWLVEGEHLVAAPIVTEAGESALYCIMFSLNRVKGLPVHLHMRVQTAYLCKKSAPVTHGSIRFAHLITLRIRGKMPPRDMGQHRKSLKVP